MTGIKKILALARMGLIHPDLMALTWKLKQSKRTYLSYSALYSLARSYMKVKSRFPTQVSAAEFGVGRGGSAVLLAWLIQRYKGRLTLYDLFGRIPAPTEIDGAYAQKRYESILAQESTNYYGNMPDLLGTVMRELSEVCDPARIEIIRGRFEDTLTQAKDKRAFCQVHIDCDWYESSKVVYDYLQGRMLPGAIIQIDDYSEWDGSRRAFHETEWLSQYETRLVDGALVIDTARAKDGNPI